VLPLHTGENGLPGDSFAISAPALATTPGRGRVRMGGPLICFDAFATVVTAPQKLEACWGRPTARI